MAKNTSGVDSVISWYLQKELEFARRGDFDQVNRCIENRQFYEELKRKIESDTNGRQCYSISQS